ncbi:MAG: hypothetical protein NZ960_01675 [Candidatus Kapabacteria bacterium]|nr:hypothetical protein [Candidatus Kapabacteria bacterium]MDW8011736.1 hypothetical protein [Bacteroidota bacterium]
MRLLCLVLVTLGSAIAQQIPQYRVEPQDGRPPRPVTAADPFELYTYYGAGLQVGWMSGIGLSFRISSPVRWGGELNAGILKLKKTSFWCLGGEVHYRLSATPSYRTYLLAGLGYYSHTTDSKPEPIWPVRFGVGLGAEVFLVELLALGAELAITAYTNGDALQVLPLPQFGLMYYFR